MALEKSTFDLATLARPKKKHNEKGRPPANSREDILDKVTKLTGVKIQRWLRFDEQLLRRAYANFMEINHDGHIKNKAAYFLYLLKLYSHD